MESNASTRKRKRGGGKGEAERDKAVAVAALVGKVAECVQEEVEDNEGITEESIAEVMSWLELELEIKLASPPAPAPAPGYVAVKGSMESCGPSFSGSSSTVLASADVRAGAPAPPAVPWPRPEALEGEEVVDDEWVAQLLTDGPEVEGQYSGQ